MQLESGTYDVDDYDDGNEDNDKCCNSITFISCHGLLLLKGSSVREAFKDKNGKFTVRLNSSFLGDLSRVNLA